MHIQVLHNYGGRLTQERRILPGVYEENDPRIFGLAHHLVQNGHAIAISAPLMPAVQPEGSPQKPPAKPESADDPEDSGDAETEDSADRGEETGEQQTSKRKRPKQE